MKKVNCILLVDDNDDDNLFHKMVIKKSGICDVVRVAENGLEALEYLQNTQNEGKDQECPKPDLIFLDINMPKMDGFEFLEAYHKLDDKFKAHAVICMLTTSLNPDDRNRAKAMNEVSDFREKPLSVEMLRDLVGKYFGE